MVIGSQHRILQILIFSILPNPQTTILQHFDASWRSFYWILHLPTFCSCGLVVDGTVVGKDSMDKKTREVADNMMYHFNWNFLHLGSDMLWWWGLTSKILSTCLTILSTCELVVDDTVDSKDNLEEETGEVAKIRIYHVTWIFFNLDVICWGDIGWHPSFFFTFNVWDNIKDMWVGGRRHCGQQGQLGGGYHEVAEIRMYHINRNFFFNLDVICLGDSGCKSLTCWTTLRTWKLVVNDTVDGKDNLEEKTREVSKIRMYHLSWVFPHLGCDMLWWCWLTSIFSHISDNI